MNFLKRFIDKAQAFRVAMQAGKLRELAELKKGQKLKKEKSDKKAYEWGSLGLSKVSAEIKKNNGQIISRRERKQLAIENNVPFVKYYND